MTSGPTTCQLVVCSLGAEEYALPIAQVREIVRYSEPRPVTSDADWVRGVISLRGRLVPVYDLAARLGLVETPLAPNAKIVIVDAGEELAGVIVDDVAEVLTVATAQIEEVAPAGGGASAPIAKLGERLVLLLDAAALLSTGEPVGAVRAAA